MKRKILSALLILALLLGTASCGSAADTAVLSLHFLDVGQGDAILLRTAEGDVLVDAGSEASQDALCIRLAELGVSSLRLAVFTHADEDHIGGADGVLRAFPTETVWITRFFEENPAVGALRSAAADTGAEIVEVINGSFYKLAETGILVLSPYGSMDGADENDKSIVLKVACGSTTALLMGDATERTEELLLSVFGRSGLRCGILKAGHHGANSSSGQAFLQAAEPDHTVISCGAGSFYGHPHGETLARLASVGSEILRTDLQGDIVFYTDGERFWRP